MYEFKRRYGFMKKTFPSDPQVKQHLTFQEWKDVKIPFLIGARKALRIPKRPNNKLEHSAQQIKAGKIRYFNYEWKQVDDWLINPDSSYKYDISKHWTEIEDLSSEAGDIKFVWEKSRFSYLYDIVRYDHHFNQDSSEFVINEVEDWIDSNPINMGPHFKCSQEISLRSLNWIFALYFYQDSHHLYESRWQKIIHTLYWQIKHVYDNINFSRICVRNNHAITECMMIYFAGLLFPFFKESTEWRKKGKQWLEEEIAYQIYDDGTFLQFSHNYQRVLVQLLTYTITLSELHKEKLSTTTYDKAIKVVEYMHHCCIGKDGQMPNYGSNDGALFFKLNDTDYTDFRPQINALYTSLTTKFLYSNDVIQEDALWLCHNHIKQEDVTIILDTKQIRTFENGGIYTIREADRSFTFFKCTRYKDRPAHADNMHLDIWMDGVNYLRDSGTYKYNTSESDINYFVGTQGHNALLVNGKNQMTKGPRFIWYNWTKQAEVHVSGNDQVYTIDSSAKMFPDVEKGGIIQKRKVEKVKGKPIWKITDEVEKSNAINEITQIWHPHPDHKEKILMEVRDEEGIVLQKTEHSGYWSEYYGQKKEVPVWCYKTRSNRITTKIKIIN